MLDHLATLTGAEFDRAYMKHMTDDHQTAVTSFDQMSREAVDADVKAWAAKMLPTLQEHLNSAKEIQRKLK